MPTIEDHTNRLQLLICCIADKGSKLSDKLKISTDCCCDINIFELLTMYWSVLVCYNPDVTTNCLTQEEVDSIWDDISCRCGLCFNPYGTDYSSLSSRDGRITEDGDRRITEDGDIRIL